MFCPGFVCQPCSRFHNDILMLLLLVRNIAFELVCRSLAATISFAPYSYQYMFKNTKMWPYVLLLDSRSKHIDTVLLPAPVFSRDLSAIAMICFVSVWKVIGLPKSSSVHSVHHSVVMSDYAHNFSMILSLSLYCIKCKIHKHKL